MRSIGALQIVLVWFLGYSTSLRHLSAHMTKGAVSTIGAAAAGGAGAAAAGAGADGVAAAAATGGSA